MRLASSRICRSRTRSALVHRRPPRIRRFAGGSDYWAYLEGVPVVVMDPKRTRPKSRASVRDVPLLDRAYEALVAQLEDEQAKGLGAESDFVFTSLSGRPLGRDRLSKRGVLAAGKRASIGHVTAQTLRRSVATATAHARVPVVIAAAMTGHSPQVYDAHNAKPFRDSEERERVRNSLASIGFGNAPVDQSVDQRPT
jgi:integrase